MPELPKNIKPNQVFKTPVKVGDNEIAIILPKSALKLLGIENDWTFCTSFDGVVQISGSRAPTFAIPATDVDEQEYKPRED